MNSDQHHERDEEAKSLRAQLEAAGLALAQTQADLRAARDRTAMLQAELQHRVRNMLAVVRSVFSRTMAAGGTLEDVANHFRGRLDTLARYEATPMTDIGGTVDLEEILRNELHSFQFGEDPKIHITGPVVNVPRDVAAAIALAIHELTTNSIKFGALSTLDVRSGVSATWTVMDGAATMLWVEHGVSVLSAAPLHRGFGREFIEQGLPYQVGATTCFELRAGGVSCSIGIPLAAPSAAIAPFM